MVAPRGKPLIELTERELEALDLPPRPRSPKSGLTDAWQALMRGVTTDHVRMLALDAPTGVPEDPRMLSFGTRFQTSRNWSGAVIVPRGDRFRFVAGQWKVPESFGQPSDISTLSADCSIWIGFGGHREWSTALPQIGTRHRLLPNGSLLHYAWIQWWVRNGPNDGELPISGFPVAPGDVIVAWAEIRPSGAVRFLIRNRTVVPPALHRRTHAQPPVAHAAARGVSAQWIVERPRDPFTREFHPLLNYGRLTFRNCGVETVSEERSVEAARMIRMVERCSATRRKPRLSDPRRRDVGHRMLTMRYTG